MKPNKNTDNSIHNRGESLLIVENVSKSYQINGTNQVVLENIGFCAYPGEVVCIVGRSGCGKTTLLNILAGFDFPCSGQARMNRKVITGPGPDRCVVFQEDTLFPWLTVQENIAFGLKGIMKNPQLRHEVDRFLELVGLQNFGHYLPREISGGMKQRVALARVLIMRPMVLLMDEPFASLDYHTRREMQELLLYLWKELQHTIIFVTHDIDEAITLADEIVVMETSPGRIRENLKVPMSRPRKADRSDYIFFRKKLLSLYEDTGEETLTKGTEYKEVVRHKKLGS